MRTIGVVTVARSDYGIYLPILNRIQNDAALRLQLFVSGAHLSPEFGMTVTTIEADGFEIASRVEMLRSVDTPEGIAESIGRGVTAFGQAYARRRPDILVVLGDRFEMFAAALAAVPFGMPIAHIHGGELTLGAIDDALRHAMTKLSHLHFVSTADYGRRVEQMGEESWRVVVSGAPALDNLRTLPRMSAAEITAQFGMATDPAPILVTFHPVTLELDQIEWQIREMLAALDAVERPIVFTQPNADAGGRRVSESIDVFVRTHPRARRVDNFGPRAYFSLLGIAAAMVGNSSSGIIEAPSFGLPVVNIGSRQDGRVRAANTIDVGYSTADILRGLRQALQPDFRARARAARNPYGDGHASEVIVERLRETPLDQRLLVKRFRDLDAVGVPAI